MNISKKDLLRVNHGFGGNLRSDSSLDFAFDKLEDKKIGLYKKLAYLLRAILVDHPFSDGNKRTAMFLAFAFAKENKKEVNRDLLIHHITSIAKDNIQEIKNIDWRLKSAIK
ncbi:Fic family protein [Candidatus Pacearchaeota archaeon]|nr:Fic family protein [Candidatus Pacearchaeota archaeon]